MSNLSTRKQNRKLKQVTENQQDDQLQVVTPNQSQMKRSKTEGLYENVYEQYSPKKRNKKFVQHSIFLPVINHRDNSDRTSEKIRNFRSQRNRLSRQKRQQQKLFNDKDSDSQGSTIQYLNECEKIIENLKKLTQQSNNKAEKMMSRVHSKDHKNKRSRARTRNGDQQNDNLQRRNRELTSRNSESYDMKDKQASQRKIKSSLNSEYDSPHLNKDGKNTDISQQQIQKAKEEEEKIRAQKKQKIFIKFLSKARNRGAELQSKIAEFRIKQSERRKLSREQNLNQSARQEPATPKVKLPSPKTEPKTETKKDPKTEPKAQPKKDSKPDPKNPPPPQKPSPQQKSSPSKPLTQKLK